MANYSCSQLVGNVCTAWVEVYPSIWEQLAITDVQAYQLVLALAEVLVSAYGIRQVMNIILQRRY